MKYEANLVGVETYLLAPARQGPASRRAIRLGVYATLALGDCAALALAFLLGNLLRFGDAFDVSGIVSLGVTLPVYLGIVMQRKPYSARFFISWRRTARDAATALVTAIVVAGIVALHLHSRTDISRSVVPIGGVIGCVLLVALRWLVHRAAMTLLDGHPIATVLILDGVYIEAGPRIATIDAADYALRPDPSDPHALDRLSAAIGKAERVVVSCSAARRAAWAATLKGANVQGEIVTPDLADIGAVRLSSLDERATIVVSLGPLDTLNRILKRGFDLAVSGTALLALWPLLVGVAVAIRLDSPGPVLFRQVRMGRGNALFSILKFRSMRTDQCDVVGNRSTERGDPRVTRVGRIIRATSIDELPQIFNVLRGDMSIVGPRPHALGSLAGDKLFWEIDKRYWDRHAVKPGITGLAQVSGFRGATSAPIDLENRLRSDIAYLRGWTLWRDIRILFSTVNVLLHRNAF